MRLIDAEQMKHFVNDYIDSTWNDLFTKHHIFEFLNSCDAIDAVPVVRCKDCKNCLIDNTVRAHHLCMRHQSVFPRKVDLMDFCSYGERGGM